MNYYPTFEQLTEYITTTYNISADNTVISAIGLDNYNYWRWVLTPRIDGCANIFCLLKNSRFLIGDNDIAYYFCDNKKQAFQEGKYFPDQRDIVSDCVGSFILWEMTDSDEQFYKITKNNLYHKIIICISTYGKKLVVKEKFSLLTKIKQINIRQINVYKHQIT